MHKLNNYQTKSLHSVTKATREAILFLLWCFEYHFVIVNHLRVDQSERAKSTTVEPSREIEKGSSYRGVRVIEGKISKKITWRGIEKGSS